MSLADDLLADLDDLGEDDQVDDQQQEQEQEQLVDEEALFRQNQQQLTTNKTTTTTTTTSTNNAFKQPLPILANQVTGFKRPRPDSEDQTTTVNADEDEEMGDLDDEGAFKAAQEKAVANLVRGKNDVKQVAKLLYSKTMQDLLRKIEMYASSSTTSNQALKTTQSTLGIAGGPVEEDPEYKVIVQSNNISSEIDNEMLIVHKFIKDHYHPKFPELESIVHNALEYAKTVQLIANETDMTNIDLKSVLPISTVMIITVTATTSQGRPLTSPELSRVMDACALMFELDATKKKIFDYVESRMHVIAPNLSTLVGSSTAAKLMSVAGGLTALSKIPACNLLVLGQTKKTNTGLSILGMQRHIGVIYTSDIITSTPQEYKRKAARLLSAKCAIVSRIDRAREHRDGQFGQQLRNEITAKLGKIMEPPPSKTIKALPIPDEGPKKRRGGRRARRLKEMYASTDLQKAQNRMVFGVQEEETMVYGETMGMGLVGQGMTGRVRGYAEDSRTKVSMSAQKKAKNKLLNVSMSSSSSSGLATSGLSSSLAFTPVQGIELVDPEMAKKKVQDANDRYFGAGKFLKVGSSQQQQQGGEKK